MSQGTRLLARGIRQGALTNFRTVLLLGVVASALTPVVFIAAPFSLLALGLGAVQIAMGDRNILTRVGMGLALVPWPVYALAVAFVMMPRAPEVVFDRSNLLAESEVAPMRATIRSLSEDTTVWVEVVTNPVSPSLVHSGYGEWEGVAELDHRVLVGLAHDDRSRYDKGPPKPGGQVNIVASPGLAEALPATWLADVAENTAAPEVDHGRFAAGLSAAIERIAARVRADPALRRTTPLPHSYGPWLTWLAVVFGVPAVLAVGALTWLVWPRSTCPKCGALYVPGTKVCDVCGV